jgi:hypothetical protein
LCAARGLLLVEQREITLIELFEPIVPGNVLQRFFAAETWKIQAQHADIAFVAGSLDTRRLRASFLRPTPDLLVIRRGE